MAVVVFDAALFREQFPQFTEEKASDAQLQLAFDMACMIFDNTDSSPVPYDPDNDVTTRQTILHFLVCHIATLMQWAASGQSGALTSATEGSVSAGFTLPTTGTNDVWFNQTPCGQVFLQAMAAYRVGPKYYGTSNYHPWG